MTTDPKQLRISDFVYPLPPQQIAEFPLPERDHSRLLILQQDRIQEDRFYALPDHLPPGTLLVFNNTRVVEARLLFQKPTGARIEIFCLEPDTRYPDISTAFTQLSSVFWKCLVGNVSAWTPGLILEKKLNGTGTLSAELMSRQKDSCIIKLSWLPAHHSFAEILHLAGSVPLPPYIKRKADAEDSERYQTVYADQSGSVAAPTAGLHFTDSLLQTLTQKNIQQQFVTLHVGAGTFKPVKSDTIGMHEMHAEFFEVSKKLIDSLLRNTGKPVAAVGTTSLRTLESLYWLGVKCMRDVNILPANLFVGQWEPYENETKVSTEDALRALLQWMSNHSMNILFAKTALLIAPSYPFRIVNILITNFHQPQSTLLLLVAAFVGDKWKSAYSYALENNFRFLSYGDSCLFFRQ